MTPTDTDTCLGPGFGSGVECLGPCGLGQQRVADGAPADAVEAPLDRQREPLWIGRAVGVVVGLDVLDRVAIPAP